MNTVMSKITTLGAVVLMSSAVLLQAQQLAFPTAEGHGKFTVGGRGGKVYEVTTLSGSGAGSLGEAIGASGPRTVVFRVAGTIDGSYKIGNSHITIAGHTAPGDGICIKGNLTIATEEVIIRYIRVRAKASGDAISGGGKKIILDHVSCSWSNDEVLSVYGGSEVTFQYCLISEACQRQNSHRFGGIWGNDMSTYHHNCFAHNDNRNPRWAGTGSGKNDYRNNILYNWGYGSCYGGTGRDEFNYVANYYKPGPATGAGVKSRIAAKISGAWYVSDNVVVGSPEVTADNWKGMGGGKRVDKPWDAMPINQETAEEAYQTFLKHGGCSFPKRDALDERIIEEIRTGTAKFGRNGIIDHPDDVGGWPELKGGEAPPDKDHDGMPDAWETSHGLNPDNAEDGNAIGAGGYTNLEIYMNSLLSNEKPTSINSGSPFRFNLSQPISASFLSALESDFPVPAGSPVKLEVFGISGNIQARWRGQADDAGILFMDAGSIQLNPGMYILKLTAPNAPLARQMFTIR